MFILTGWPDMGHGFVHHYGFTTCSVFYFLFPNFCAEVEMRTVKLKIFFLVRKYIKQPEEEEPPQKLLKKQKSQHQHAAKT
jgi:hypothetical protein